MRGGKDGTARRGPIRPRGRIALLCTPQNHQNHVRSFPSVVNIPLMTNDERHEVGICYKEQGQEAAIKLGNALVTGAAKAERLERWSAFCRSNPTEGYLYCHRGGLRSNIVRDWIQEETGVRYPLVAGGYKAMRQFLLDELDRSMDPKNTEVVMLCGKTGSGKTRVIERMDKCSIDLEGLANHRGSAFGSFPGDEQPSQIDFENSLSVALLKLLDADARKAPKPVLVEDESNRIGRVGLPGVLKERMDTADGGIVLIEETLEARVDVLVEDYVVDLGRRFARRHGDEDGPGMHRQFLLDALKRIKNRLGGDRYEQVRRTMEAACDEERIKGNTSLHRVWLAALLEQYYDKMYDYQLSSHDRKVIFRGSRDAVTEWATATYQAN